MEEALWKLEDKFRLSTQKAITLFACTCVLVIITCVVTMMKRRKSRRQGVVHQEPYKGESNTGPPAYQGWYSVKKVLVGSVRWSGPSKWEEGVRAGSQRDAPSPLLVTRDVGGAPEVGWQSHNSTSAVWQRPILMGEKCELPRFSGLILYDQKGTPLHHCEQGITIDMQDKTAEVVRTTLRDLL